MASINILNKSRTSAKSEIIDERDRKKGRKTDYVARQYLGSTGKIDNGIVCVNAYGVYENITFPLAFRVFKPKGTLKENDTYKTKIELASSIINEIIDSFNNNSDSVIAFAITSQKPKVIYSLVYELPQKLLPKPSWVKRI